MTDRERELLLYFGMGPDDFWAYTDDLQHILDRRPIAGTLVAMRTKGWVESHKRIGGSRWHITPLGRGTILLDQLARWEKAQEEEAEAVRLLRAIARGTEVETDDD